MKSFGELLCELLAREDDLVMDDSGIVPEDVAGSGYAYPSEECLPPCDVE
jgi:hypothetical protein